MTLKESTIIDHLLFEWKSFSDLAVQSHNVYTYRVECSLLPQMKQSFDFQKRKECIMGELFTKLDDIKSPILYWFEAKDNDSASILVNEMESFRSMEGRNRNIPVINDNTHNGGNVIYVGIRQGGVRKKDGFTNAASRIFIHLGLYSKGSTQGLQLSYWATQALELNILQFPNGSGKYLGAFEKLFALELKPRFGKH